MQNVYTPIHYFENHPEVIRQDDLAQHCDLQQWVAKFNAQPMVIADTRLTLHSLPHVPPTEIADAIKALANHDQVVSFWLWGWTMLVAVYRDGEDEQAFLTDLIAMANPGNELAAVGQVVKVFSGRELENRDRLLKRLRPLFVERAKQSQAAAA